MTASTGRPPSINRQIAALAVPALGALLAEPAEKALAGRLVTLLPRFDELWARDDFDALFALLQELRPTVDAFFDTVMVMCEDAAVRANRLNLLRALVQRLERLADFAALQI